MLEYNNTLPNKIKSMKRGDAAIILSSLLFFNIYIAQRALTAIPIKLNAIITVSSIPKHVENSLI